MDDPAARAELDKAVEAALKNRSLLDAETRRAYHAVVVSECIGLYKLVVGVATAFLGATLLFLEKVTPEPTRASLVVLAIGWVLLIASIFSVAWVRRLNIEAGRVFLDGDYNQSDRLQGSARFCTTGSTVLLAAGMAAIMLFGLLNFL